MPSFVPPMLATSGRPDGPLDGWMVEPKADGWRAQVAIDSDGLHVWTRRGRDIAVKVPKMPRGVGGLVPTGAGRAVSARRKGGE